MSDDHDLAYRIEGIAARLAAIEAVPSYSGPTHSDVKALAERLAQLERDAAASAKALDDIATNVRGLIQRGSGLSADVLQALADPIADKLNEYRARGEKDVAELRGSMGGIVDEARRAALAGAQAASDIVERFAVTWAYAEE